MKHQIRYCNVSRETFKQVDLLLKKHRSDFEEYIERLLWWNKRLNLVSRNVSRETFEEHIRHSLLLTQFETFRSGNLIVDTGTGGGLPGIPLAIAFPEKQFLLNDIASKKIRALGQIIKHLGLSNVLTNTGSIAGLLVDQECLLVSKHAFKINKLVEMSKKIPYTELIFYKGLNFEEEVRAIRPALRISAYDLSTGTEDRFYKDKALLFVSRK